MGREALAPGFSRVARIGAFAFGCLMLAHCSSPFQESKYGPRVAENAEVPKGGGRYSVGKPYTVHGKTYYPAEDPNYRAEGTASWYGPDFHGRLTANGEIYDMHGISAAHVTMPLPSYARVTNLANGKSIIVRVNNRGPFVHNRIIDLSIGTAKALGFYGHGLARVRVEYVGRAPLEGSDDRMLLATLREGSPAPAPSPVMVASAKPFLPNPRNADHDSVKPPLPAQRPFALGAGGARPAAPAAATEVASASRPQARSVVRLPEGQAPEPRVEASASPTSAFGPARNEGAVGLMSGRGLY